VSANIIIVSKGNILGQARHLLPIQEYVGEMGAAEGFFLRLHFVSLLQLLYESGITNKLRHWIFSSLGCGVRGESEEATVLRC
jgi:hypothetical protein